MRLVVVVLLTFACSSKSSNDPPAGSSTPPQPAVDAPAAKPTGSDGSATGSGSATAGSGSGSAEGSGSAVATGSGSGSGGDFDFDKLTHDQQMDFMKKTVVPAMKPIFQDFDKKKYAVFGCKTCHGKDPAKTKYKMPSSDIPKLDFDALHAGKQKPEVAKWMGEVVKPQMAKLLHQPEMTQTNPKGFGCLECHEQKK